ncbi:hypothetical protein FOL47_004187 [Perkinsus chesapeaki]|uniref:RING-type domain-containing protein n=1 Tax=Perkinsus chesapeaki TaxID=330153 RepID=A0A7J6MZC1_PERCH|nr:hypothetical protein FOL47_004187 [Perkinsus chesapeaki]
METIHQVRGPAGPAHSAAPKEPANGPVTELARVITQAIIYATLAWSFYYYFLPWYGGLRKLLSHALQAYLIAHLLIELLIRIYLGVVSRMIIKALDKLRVKFRRRKHRRRGKHRRKQKSRGKWWKRQLTDKSALRLKALRVLPYKKVPQCSRAESECTICLATFKNIDQCRILPCKHFFHRECIDSTFCEFTIA